MIINGKSIKGIYFYVDSVTFEKGDFVVSDNKLYIAKAESTGNNPTEHPELFELYQGTDMATMQDYLEYTKDQNNIDLGEKAISIPVLASILNKYFSGFSENGIINNEITPSGDIILKDFFSNTVSEINTTNPLDQVLYAQDLNNSIFCVSREVVVGLMPGDGIVILRQYTYKDTSNSGYCRIQELFDPKDGELIYRYTTWKINESMSSENTVAWKNVTSSSELLDKVSKIRNYYESQKASTSVSGKLNKIDVSSSSLDIYYSGANKANNPDGVNLINLDLRNTDIPACIMLSSGLYRDSVNIDLKYVATGTTKIVVNSDIDLNLTIVGSSSSSGDKLTISVNSGSIVGFYYLTYN